MATVSDIDDKTATHGSWEIGVSFAGEGGAAADAPRGLGVDGRGEGGGITVRGVRETGGYVDRAVLKVRVVSGPGIGPGISSAASWGGAVVPDEALVDLACTVEKSWAGEAGVGLVGEDKTCDRVSTKEVRGGIYGLPNRLEIREACPWC